MGSVYEAEQTLGSSQRSVAVKLLRPEWSHDPAVKARFHREAATVARLEHFNTVRVYDFGATEDGTLYIVMEYLQGRSLQKVLDDTGPLPPERVEHITSQVLASLEEAHGLGIVHRDLKPDNILLIDSYASQRDVVKLVDFGIAKGQPALGAASTRLTELGAFVGTPAYMSPEQFTPGGVGPASDIYSLGVTTYQMLAGRLPFDAQSALEWAQAHTSKEPPPLADQYGAGAIPDRMRRAVRRALSKQPEERPATARMFAEELSGRTSPDAVPREPAAASARVVEASAPPAAAAPALGGAPKTAPMIELPDLNPVSRVPLETQPMAAFRQPAAPVYGVAVHAPEPRPRRSGPGRFVLWTALAFAGTAGLSLGAWALYDNQLWPGQQRESREPPPLTPTASEPEPEPEPTPEPVPEPAPRERERAEPAPSNPSNTPRPAAPRPAPAPKPASPSAPSPTPTLPQLPGLPSPAQPGTPPAAPGTALPGQPAPGAAPPTPPSASPLPQLPWNLPTTGSCERCLQALQGSGNYIVVTAVGESLLCEDRTARATCERQIEELAPAVAERAARAGDCPAAIATAAAAVNVRVSPDRFRSVDALCLR